MLLFITYMMELGSSPVSILVPNLISKGDLISMVSTVAKSKVNVDRQWQSFIDGKAEKGATERQLYNPADGSPLCKVSEADTKMVEKAIKVARKAFDEGPPTSARTKWPNFGSRRTPPDPAGRGRRVAHVNEGQVRAIPIAPSALSVVRPDPCSPP